MRQGEFFRFEFAERRIGGKTAEGLDAGQLLAKVERAPDEKLLNWVEKLFELAWSY
jgi:hypothetical protein